MTRSEIYKAISDLIADSDGASIDYVIGINDMGRYLAEGIKEAPAPAPKKEGTKKKIDIDMGKVKALKAAGRSIDWIADDMGVSAQTIHNRLKEEGEENAKLD